MPERTPNSRGSWGQQLYVQWCGSPASDRARYWAMMNPADKEAWERLAVVVAGDQGALARLMAQSEALKTALSQAETDLGIAAHDLHNGAHPGDMADWLAERCEAARAELRRATEQADAEVPF